MPAGIEQECYLCFFSWAGNMEVKNQRVTASNRFANVLLGREGRLPGWQLGRLRLVPHAASLGLRRSSSEEASDCNHEGSLHTGSTITPPSVGTIGNRIPVWVCRRPDSMVAQAVSFQGWI